MYFFKQRYQKPPHKSIARLSYISIFAHVFRKELNRKVGDCLCFGFRQIWQKTSVKKNIGFQEDKCAAANGYMTIFLVVTPRKSYVLTNVSEKNNTSTFRVVIFSETRNKLTNKPLTKLKATQTTPDIKPNLNNT